MSNSAVITAASPAVVINKSQTACFFKRRWEDDWTWVPDVEARRAVEACAPTIGEASFLYQFGEIKRHTDTDFDFYLPVLVGNCYCMIRAYNEYAPADGWPVWLGIIQDETAHVYGSVFPAAEQCFEALSLEHLLDRIEINRAFTEDGEIERAVAFNKKDGNGILSKGNRSTDVDSEGVYVFSRDGEQWSNLDILNHLLVKYVEDGIRFEVQGATQALEAVFEEHAFFGMSVYQAINKLVDRRFGLGWRLLIPDTPGANCIIYIFSQLPYTVQLGDVTVPANPVQDYVVNTNNHLVDVTMAFSATHQYDSVEVVGQNLLVCGTFSYTDDTLERGWTDAEQAAYENPGHDDSTLDDTARRAEKYDRVYQAHRVPYAWAGTTGDGIGGTLRNAHPVVNDDGSVDWTAVANFWRGERRFERNIPLKVETLDTDAPEEFRAAFAAIKQPDGKYNYVEKAWGDDETTRFPGHMSLLDRELGIKIAAQINHVYGLNTFENDSTDITPAFDFHDLIVTAAFRTDSRLRVLVQVPGQFIGEVPRKKIIVVPDAEWWAVMAQTVTDIVDGALVRTREDAEGTETEDTVILRDDTDMLRQVAALAQLWFATANATVTVEIKDISPAYPVSTLLLAAAGNWHATRIGTPVTQRVWDFKAGTTSVVTGYDEIAFGDAVMKKKKTLAKKIG